VTLHLLSPARRRVQVTRDLAGFWRTTYFEVRKDLRGRYPKHIGPTIPCTPSLPAGRSERGRGREQCALRVCYVTVLVRLVAGICNDPWGPFIVTSESTRVQR
jgi:hypothetical protein